MGVFGDIADFLTSPFLAAAGWAWDTVVTGLTDWVMKGALALLMMLWGFMDAASRPQLDAEWFARADGAPLQVAAAIGVVMVSLLVVAAVIQAVMAGSPGAVVKTVAHDLPAAVFAMVALVAVTAAGLEITDGISDWIWIQTEDDAQRVMDQMGLVLMAVPGNFLGVVFALALIVSMLFMWAVLFIREALIYLVVVYAVAFGLPAMIFKPLRDTSKKTLELLVALVLAKPFITLAVSVGLSALGGVGATGEPGEGAVDNLSVEMGTLFVGVVTFGLAAFMPFLIWKLMPVVAAAVVAQGIASGPMRGFTQAMQLQYYGSATMRRMSTGTPTGAGAWSSIGSSTGGGGGGVAPAAATSAGGATDRLLSPVLRRPLHRSRWQRPPPVR